MNVGAAQIDITPDFIVELAGFASRKHPCTGVAEPIFARCVYLEDGGGERLLWITADVLAFQPEFVDAFRSWCEQALDLRPHQVVLAATHTHSAPTTIHITGAGTYSAEYVALLRDRFEQLAAQAVQAARRCEVVSAVGSLDLAIDRRNKPTRHVDPRVWALGFRKPGGGDFVAAVVNYAMHPVALGSEERCISPDWCGGTVAKLAASLPGSPVAMVTNGAAGNINPPYHAAPREQVRAWGEAVADAVVDKLVAAKPVTGARLAVRSVHVRMSLDAMDADAIERTAEKKLAEINPAWEWKDQFTAAVNAWRQRVGAMVRAGQGQTHDVELQAARIGDVVVLAVNGEMFSRFTDDVRAQSNTPNLFVVGYANRGFGYVPTREAYAEGGYETDTAHFFYGSFRPQPGSLELLADRAAELVSSMR